MTGKEPTPRQVRERAAHEAEKAAVDHPVSKARVSRDYLRKKAGWPPLKVK